MIGMTFVNKGCAGLFLLCGSVILHMEHVKIALNLTR